MKRIIEAAGTEMDVAAKAAVRAKLKALREAIAEPDRLRHSAAICERLLALDVVRMAGRVFVFISSGTEVHTHDLIHHFLAAGCEVSVPKIVGRRQMIACRLRDWSGLKAAQLGILTPIATEPVDGPFNLTITPGLGFTESGHRIGYGAGYYDHWFTRHEGGVKIALAFEAQILRVIPATPYDIPVDAIVTEQRLIAVNTAVR